MNYYFIISIFLALIVACVMYKLFIAIINKYNKSRYDYIDNITHGCTKDMYEDYD